MTEKYKKEFFFLDKKEDILRRGTKRVTQGIQYIYNHHQNGIKGKKNNPTEGANTTSTRTQPINKKEYIHI